MSATTKRLFRHMAWANQKVYSAVQSLPDEALSAYLHNPEWNAGHILQHIVGGADWYQHCLTKDPWREIADPKTMADVAGLAKILAEFDAKIASQVDLPDEYLTLSEGEKSWQNLRSTLLAEAIYHATEHRAQLMDALESKGHSPINLDDIDLWAFERFEKSQGK
jgi:uncharacterized damage-inducible protein DinB